jgi:hypothetical protein
MLTSCPSTPLALRDPIFAWKSVLDPIRHEISVRVMCTRPNIVYSGCGEKVLWSVSAGSVGDALLPVSNDAYMYRLHWVNKTHFATVKGTQGSVVHRIRLSFSLAACTRGRLQKPDAWRNKKELRKAKRNARTSVRRISLQLFTLRSLVWAKCRWGNIMLRPYHCQRLHALQLEYAAEVDVSRSGPETYCFVTRQTTRDTM